MKHHKIIAWLGLLAGIYVTQAVAQYTPGGVVEGDYQGIPFISGGIGEDERDALLHRQRDFNLKLVFADQDGSYRADVDVLVLNPRGEPVFSVMGAGPIVLTRLPRGNYRIKAESNGQVRQASIGIAGNSQREQIFRW